MSLNWITNATTPPHTKLANYVLDPPNAWARRDAPYPTDWGEKLAPLFKGGKGGSGCLDL
jgi:hypothetical protein